MENEIRKLSFSIFLIGFITQLEENGVFVDTSHFELVDGFYLSRSIAFCGGEAGAKAVDFSELAGCFGGCRRHCDEDSGRVGEERFLTEERSVGLLLVFG